MLHVSESDDGKACISLSFNVVVSVQAVVVVATSQVEQAVRHRCMVSLGAAHVCMHGWCSWAIDYSPKAIALVAMATHQLAMTLLWL